MTERQAEVLRFFTAYTRREGVPPSVREVGRHFGMTPRSAFEHLTSLARHGRLRHRDGARQAHAFVLPEGEAPSVARLRERIVRELAATYDGPLAVNLRGAAFDMKARILQLVDEELAR